MGKDRFSIIYFGNDWTAENRTSSHHIAERLANRMPLLYVDSAGLRAPTTSRRDIRKAVRKILAAFRAPQQVGPRMWHISSPQIPFRRLPFVNLLNRLVGAWLVRRAIRKLRFREVVSWFVVPHPGPLAGSFAERLIVYYCIDDYAALPGVDSAEVTQMDTNLTRCADQVFVASSLMLEQKLRLNRATALAPHGVDVALFRTAADARLPVVEAVRTLDHPIVGFFGLIEAWIDLDLIASIAERRPQWTFLMIGRVAVDPGRAKTLPNVRFVGPQPYRSLPNWAKAFDVAIIPYRLTRQVVNAAPLKLREYLATGKPVVAVPTPEVERFAGLVRTARGTEEFIQQIESALSNDPEADRVRRMEATRSMTWDRRIGEVVEIVERRLRQKEHSHP